LILKYFGQFEIIIGTAGFGSWRSPKGLQGTLNVTAAKRL